jgi:hypothetical protein
MHLLLNCKKRGTVKPGTETTQKQNVHTIRSTQRTLKRKKLNHDVTFKKTRRNTYKKLKTNNIIRK